jgi:hypothetical protein
VSRVSIEELKSSASTLMCSEPVEGHTAAVQASAEDAALARIVRREAGLIVAQLQRRLGNFDVAEEAVQEAIIIALRT